uniref:Uncharacterized protein n=1 Tax=Taeniopygia guttata TaxID=59729 RepID=A0A674HGQ2_TAEGU
ILLSVGMAHGTSNLTALRCPIASRVFKVLKGQGSFFFCFLKAFEIHLPATPPGKLENLHQYYSVTWLPTQHHSKTSSPPRNTHARTKEQTKRSQN